jgi:predicted transcriptional regulator
LEKSLQPSSQLGATTETQTETTDPLLQILKQEITNNEWGETIPMKRIMAKHNARHERLKPIFEQLIESKIIERQGNRYINTQTQNKVQEQTA